MRRFGYAAVLLLLFSAVRSTRADVVERVVAVVNDEALFLSELRQRVVPYLQRLAQAPEMQRQALLDQLYHEMLQELVADELFRQKAAELDLRVTSEEVERGVETSWRSLRITEEEFWEQRRLEGFSLEQYRAEMRRYLLRTKVLNQVARSRVNITEDDVRRRYREEVRRATRTVRSRAAHVFFRLPQGASATEVAAIRAQVEEVRRSLTVANFAETAARVGGGELGWLAQGDLPTELDETLAAMQPGSISGVVRGPNGLHLLLLYEREQGGADVPTFEQARDAIYRSMIQQAMARQDTQLLEELRRQAIVDVRL